ncbi:S26 family signal peptidase [Frondihabitans sp. 4ASC-45]|uniref:S26 family signal peptidase n=1 Tax=Frondihabitans sp. 4ASC-45 TaxID=3111636 RepID=UPI003C2439C1
MSRAPQRHRGQRRRLPVITLTALLVLVAVLAGVVALWTSGVRWFVVETPSMATTAPVGTLVIAHPVTPSALQVGQVISFHPPTVKTETYTHRITAISDKGLITTKGDLNGATDPWRLSPSDVIGEVGIIVPGLGWLLRATPYLLAGFLLTWAVSTRFRSPPRRSAARVVGVATTVSVTASILRPWCQAVVVTASTTPSFTHASVVSTGILPIKVTLGNASSDRLTAGTLTNLSAATPTHGSGYQLATALDLPWWGWGIVAVFCSLPLLWTVLVGLPQPAPEEGDE